MATRLNVGICGGLGGMDNVQIQKTNNSDHTHINDNGLWNFLGVGLNIGISKEVRIF